MDRGEDIRFCSEYNGKSLKEITLAAVWRVECRGAGGKRGNAGSYYKSPEGQRRRLDGGHDGGDEG